MPARQRPRRGSLVVYADGDIVVRRDPDRPTGRMVTISGMESSYVDIADPTYLEFAYVRRIRDVVDTRWPTRGELDVIHLGGAGCTLPRYLVATRPKARNLVFEYDARVADVARRVLGVQNGPRLKLKVTDARAALAERPDDSADVIVGDAFVDGLVPAHLASAEFAADVARVLRPGGVFAFNVVDIPPARISRRVAATLRLAFPVVQLIAPQRVLRGRTVGNLVFVAGDTVTPLERLRTRAARDGEPTETLEPGEVEFFAAGAKPIHDGDPL